MKNFRTARKQVKYNNPHLSSRRARDNDSYQRPYDDEFTTPFCIQRDPLTTKRDGRYVGDTVHLFDGIQVLALKIWHFDVGDRCVLIDSKGYFHWAVPATGCNAPADVDFVTMLSNTNKQANGWKPKPEEIVRVPNDEPVHRRNRNHRHVVVAH